MRGKSAGYFELMDPYLHNSSEIKGFAAKYIIGNQIQRPLDRDGVMRPLSLIITRYSHRNSDSKIPHEDPRNI